ncbi:Mbeg1-like protein [Ligilactobacillus sp. UO.C109]|uniref:Mbeg1-like protein n=1 Tax=Ligilactobacillus sp. UO.C109 TaxID=3003264 RepID=UPI00228572F1|nr:Mbeg1-like protein [Ligilactobacillus sp. UO.C109]MCZ0744358.1 DUF2974 domain-containing protein [Ligilactobacillus sp. UO.C109]
MEKKVKYSIRKKSGVRAASYIIGVSLLGGSLMMTPPIQANEVTPTTPTTTLTSQNNTTEIKQTESENTDINKATNTTTNESTSDEVISNNTETEQIQTPYPTNTSANNDAIYKITDTDHDGIIDQYDKNPEKWDVSDRDLRFFTELSYRSPQELDQIFTGNNDTIDKFNQEKTFNVADVREILDDWRMDRQINNPDGFSATFFSTKDNQVVVAFRGTNDNADADDDIDIFNGAQPGQVKNLDQVLKDLQPYKEIYLTGHSLGGYLAEYFAATKLMYDPRFVRGAVFNAPGIKDSWSWISGKLEHRLAAENSKILSKEFYTNDADSRVTILGHKMQSYAIHKDTVGSLYYYPNTQWAYAVNGTGTHSSGNFFGKKYSSEIKNWFTVGYRMDTPYVSEDADHDGFGDQLEKAIGTNYMDSNSKPTLNAFYKVKNTGNVVVPTFSDLNTYLINEKISVEFDPQYEYYKKQIPTFQPVELKYEYLNYPQSVADNVESIIVQVKVDFPDGSKSVIIDVPVEFQQAKTLNVAKDKIKDRIDQMLELTVDQKDNFNKQINEVTNIRDLAEVLKSAQEQADLNLKTSKNELESLIAESVTVKKSVIYVKADEDKRQAYDDLLETARAVLDDKNVTKIEIDSIISKLKQTQLALNGKEETPVGPSEPGKEPETPVAPSEPGKEPETPVDPSEPGKEPETPVDPSEPGKEPETPVDPSEPGKEPETPVDPSEPGKEPETPVDPSKPGKEPETPVDPSKPGKEPETPVDPSEPGKEPETPVAPSEPGKEPETPVAPSEPGKEPENPVAPSEPGKEPETPVDPSEPGKEPETPVGPSEPGKEPETPVDPSEPGKEPEIPVDPSESGKEPETPVDPSEPGKEPETPVDPSEPGKEPEIPVDPSEPGKEPEIPVDPSEPGKEPETPVAPSEPGKEPETPVDPSEPGKEPETPVDLSEPGKEPETPIDPSEPGKEPEIPVEPSESGKEPETSVKPSEPGKEPEIPVEPSEPGKEPETPVNPSEPGKEPETPIDPSEPGKEPETPVDPSEPGKEPETPVDPSKPGKEPETPVNPSEPGKEPETPVDPSEPGKELETPVGPSEPGKEPETPVDPSESGKEPETPVDPSEPGKEPETPVDSSEPGKEPETPVDPSEPGKEPETPVELSKKSEVKSIFDNLMRNTSKSDNILKNTVLIQGSVRSFKQNKTQKDIDEKLPQTGNKVNNLTVSGAILLGMAGMIVGGELRKKREDK